MNPERKPRRRTPAPVLAMIVSAMFAAPAMACTVTSSPLVFGEIDPLVGQATDSVATLTVSCPETTSYSIAISSDIGGHAMSAGANTLAYELYSDASYSTVWGDGTGGTVTVEGMAGPLDSTHDIYGRVPPQPATVPGTYADVLMVTISY